MTDHFGYPTPVLNVTDHFGYPTPVLNVTDHFGYPTPVLNVTDHFGYPTPVLQKMARCTLLAVGQVVSLVWVLQNWRAIHPHCFSCPLLCHRCVVGKTSLPSSQVRENVYLTCLTCLYFEGSRPVWYIFALYHA